MARNSSKRVAIVVATESAYGVPPSFAPIIDDNGMFIYQNATPVGFDGESVNLDPIRDGFTPSLDAPGRFLRPFTPTWFLQGSGDIPDSPAAPVAVRAEPLLLACGMQVTATSAGSHIEYGPDSSLANSAAVLADLDKQQVVIPGIYGNFTINCTSGQPMNTDFNMQGLWQAFIDSGDGGYIDMAGSPAFDPGPTLAQTFKKCQGSITRNGSPATVWSCTTPAGIDALTVRSLQFDRGITIEELPDACADDGVAGIQVSEAVPTVQVVLEMKDSIRLNFEQDMKDLVTHSLSFVMGQNGPDPVGTAADRGREWLLTVPQAQITNVQRADGQGNTREVTVSYKATHSTLDAEFRLRMQ